MRRVKEPAEEMVEYAARADTVLRGVPGHETLELRRSDRRDHGAALGRATRQPSAHVSARPSETDLHA